jgi:hypothetical protein
MTSSKSNELAVKSEGEKDVQDDYEFARSKYYELVEKGDEAIELMLDLARESEHPRAFEVLSTMIKQNAEIADRLMDLQKKKKEVKKFDQLPNGGNQPQQLTQNNVYVGSTTDLQRMLAAKMKKAPEVIDDNSNED